MQIAKQNHSHQSHQQYKSCKMHHTFFFLWNSLAANSLKDQKYQPPPVQCRYGQEIHYSQVHTQKNCDHDHIHSHIVPAIYPGFLVGITNRADNSHRTGHFLQSHLSADQHLQALNSGFQPVADLCTAISNGFQYTTLFSLHSSGKSIEISSSVTLLRSQHNRLLLTIPFIDYCCRLPLMKTAVETYFPIKERTTSIDTDDLVSIFHTCLCCRRIRNNVHHCIIIAHTSHNDQRQYPCQNKANSKYFLFLLKKVLL